MYGKVFASIYNNRWLAFGKRVSPLVLDFYEKISPANNGHVLDLCCGTGVFSLAALMRGHNVTGLDASPDMLHWAEDNAREYIQRGLAEFVVGRAEAFDLPRKYGLCVSLFDSLNHLNNMDELRGCARSVARALLPGGRFMFDLNTEKGLTKWNQISLIDEKDLMLVNRGVYVAGSKKAFVKISGFAKNDDGQFERFEEDMWNTVYPCLDVVDMLRETGYTDICMSVADSLGVPLDDPEAENRVFFLAKRPS